MGLSAKLYIFIFSFWIIGNIICGVTEGATITPTVQTNIEETINVNPMSPTWYSYIGKAFTWDYSIFKNTDGSSNDWAYIKYIFLYPLTAAITITIAMLILPALISAIGSIFRWR